MSQAQLKRCGSGRKICPSCGSTVHSRRPFCGCGYSFSAAHSFEDHRRLIRFIAAKFTNLRDVEDSDEFGDACVGWVEAMQDYNGSTRSTTCVTTYCRNAIIDGIRVRANQVRGQKADGEMDSYVDDGHDDRAAFARELLSPAAGDSPEVTHNREVLVRWLSGETYSEIAESLNATIHVVRRRIFGAITHICTRHAAAIREFRDANS